MCANHAKLCNSCKKKLIDEKLQQCASLYTNLGMESTDEERLQAKSKEQEILYEIMAIDEDKGKRLLNIE
jgi:hypothetical protein